MATDFQLEEEKRRKTVEESSIPEQVTSSPERLNKREISDDEIDLRDVILPFWNKRFFILKVTAVFLVIGVIWYILSPEEYQASTRLMNESAGGGSSAASGLMQRFGLNIPGGGDGSGGNISAALYPDIVSSTPFLVHIIDNKVYFAEVDSSLSVYDYFTKVKGTPATDIIRSWTIGLPGRVIRWITGPSRHSDLPVTLPEIREQGDDLKHNLDDALIEEPKEPLLALNRSQIGVINQLKGRINVQSSGSIINVNVRMPDPMAAAALTKVTVNYLTDYIIKYKTEKVRSDLKFVQERYEEAKERFVLAQNELASFRDRNMNVVSARARTEEQRLQNEFDLAFSVYNSLAQQLEQSKIKVQEERPVFSVLEPVQVPINSTEPSMSKIVGVAVFFGIFIGFGWILWGIISTRIKLMLR
jgi:hypothetical protein